MPPIPKRQIRLVCRDELVPSVILSTSQFAQLGEAETVENLAVRIVRRILVDGMRGNFDSYASGDVLPIA